MNFHQIFIEIATSSTFVNGSLYVRGQRFLRSVWVNWFEKLPKKVKYIFDIQNGGLAAILFEICILYFFFTNFHQIFIEIATVPTISNGFLWN